MNLFLRKMIGIICKVLLIGLGYGSCKRCGRTWNICKDHCTPYTEDEFGGGCFPLCEECWSELLPEERLPYYIRLMDEWQKGGSDKPGRIWETLRKNVIDGK